VRDEWFCSGPEGRTGPLTLQELKLLLAKHFHADDIYIWHESMLGWVRAGDFGGLDNICPADQSRPHRRPTLRPLDIDNYRPEDESARLKKRRFSIRGVAVALLLMILGCVVVYLGMIGGFGLLAKDLNFNTAEIGALAGLVFFVIGGAVIWRSRYRVRRV
jgi:hypothetical protein